MKKAQLSLCMLFSFSVLLACSPPQQSETQQHSEPQEQKKKTTEVNTISPPANKGEEKQDAKQKEAPSVENELYIGKESPEDAIVVQPKANSLQELAAAVGKSIGSATGIATVSSEVVSLKSCGPLSSEATVNISAIHPTAMMHSRSVSAMQSMPQTSAVFNTEEYDRVYEDRFVNPIDTPLSTFSIDVDTASYSNIRRFINSSQTPPADVVRLEEMINYFNYDYPQPNDKHPFSITTELSECPWNTKHQLLHIGLQGKIVPPEEVPDSNLVFLLDVSGSMDSPNKLPLLKRAFRLLIRQLTKNDSVAIVVYAGASGVVLQPTPGNETTTIIRSLDALDAGGSTAGGEGIQKAYALAKKHFITDGNNRVILATDGDFNVGVSSDGELIRLIEEKRKEGIFLTVLGFGSGNYKDSKMEKLADSGNGNYAYIDSIREAKKVLVKELAGTLLTIAKDVKIQVEFNPSKVESYRLIGYENRKLQKEDFADDTKDAGELGSGHSVTALYEIIPADSQKTPQPSIKLKYQESNIVPANKNTEICMIKLRYKEPDKDTSILLSQPVNNSAIALQKSSDNFRFSASAAEFGLLLRKSKYAKNASYLQVLELGKGAKGKDSEGYRAEFIRLVETIQLLQETKEK